MTAEQLGRPDKASTKRSPWGGGDGRRRSGAARADYSLRRMYFVKAGERGVEVCLVE